jgi:putative membrane protein insertion efficiency factor
MSTLVIAAVRLYKALLSPVLPFNHCRYYPSCSDYAIQAVEKFGTVKGGWLAVKRIGRCHPYGKHGIYDPVP